MFGTSEGGNRTLPNWLDLNHYDLEPVNSVSPKNTIELMKSLKVIISAICKFLNTFVGENIS